MIDLKDYKKIILTKKDKRVLLRPPRKGDVDKLLRYINDLADEDTFIIVNKRLTRKEEVKYLKERFKAVKEKKGFNLLAFYKERIVANGEIKRAGNRQEHLGELAISVSKGFRDEGLGTELIKELINLAKGFLKVKIIFLRVFGNNTRAIHYYQKFGFKECGRIPKGVFYKEKYIDDVLMCLNLDRKK